jgi:hypothetical protein
VSCLAWRVISVMASSGVVLVDRGRSMEVRIAKTICLSNSINLIYSIGQANVRLARLERSGEMVPESAPMLDAVRDKCSEKKIS